jgi:molybdopterin biosynthesis enzyme MoaB
VGRLFKTRSINFGLVVSTSSSVLNKVKEIDRKIDELREFLEDVFLTPEEYRLLRDADNMIKERKLGELTPLDEVQGSTSQKS